MALQTRRAPVRLSLTRPLLMAGAEREAVGLVWLGFPLLGWLSGNVLYLGAGVAVAFVLHQVLKMLAKRDPQALKVARRSFARSPFYPARPDTGTAPDYAGRYRAPPLKALLNRLGR